MNEEDKKLGASNKYTEDGLKHIQSLGEQHPDFHSPEMAQYRALLKLEAMTNEQFDEFLSTVPQRTQMLIRARISNWREVLPQYLIEQEQLQANENYAKNQKVIATIELQAKWLNSIELDVLANGVLLGDSSIFRNGRLSLLGIGSEDGKEHLSFDDIKEEFFEWDLTNLQIYMYLTGTKKPLPWNRPAILLKYKITGVKKSNRFIEK